MIKYTHTPWIVKDKVIKYYVPARYPASEYWQSVPRTEENLRLMSAAPELLEALLALIHQPSDVPSIRPWSQACAAIAKVEGCL